jgi:hypothetical protein
VKNYLKILILIGILGLILISIFIKNKNEKTKIPKAEPQPVKEEEEKIAENLLKANWQWVDEQKKLYELSPAEINPILEELWERFPNKAERLKALSILRLGTPYQLGPLGEESGRDKDPVFRLDVTDCTAFVLTDVALLHSQSLEEAKGMMKFVNYQPPNFEITFENRLHFTTDRNTVSPYFRDITAEIAGLDKVREKKIILNKIKTDGKRLIDINWEKEIVIKYIPNEFITKEFLKKFPKTIGIAFVKEGDEEIGLDIRHEGFLFDDHLLVHATPTEGKLVEIDFFEYYFGKEGNPRFDGIILFEIK